MKKLILLAEMMVIAMTCSAEDILDVFLREDRVPLGSPVELGVWNGDLDACKALADKRGIPMIAVWSNRGCAHCEILEKAFHSDAFRNWAKACGMILCFTCSDDPHGKSLQKETDESRYKFFCKISPSGTLKDFPFVRFYWYTDNGKTRKVDYNVKGDTVDKQQGIYMKSYDKAGNICIDYIMNKSGFGAYVPKPTYLGGVFDVPAVDASDACAQLQAEPTTKTVYVPMRRDVSEACEQTLTIADAQANGGNELPVSWAEGETNKTIEIANFNTVWYKKGHEIVVTAKNDDGDVESQVAITCVDVQPNTADNPYWIGEKTMLAFGEWTMDLAAAKALAEGATGEAYTLVALLGSLWCHDCANTARNFLDVEDAGVNKFKAWAVKKQVALVTVDIPDFTDPEGDFASPCLLSRTAYTSTLAYEMPAYGMYDVSKGGAPESLTKATLRSGLGYLTRKGITDEAASAQLAVVHDLAVKDTAEGGFHRPEDTKKNRTGVPIFVLLRKDGSVAARFTRFASKSPMTADAAVFDDIIKRFDEMLAIAASTGNHADPSEIENNYPGDRAISFAANGGTASNELCNADFQDAFKLTGVGGNADQKVTVKGASGAQVSVQFWQKAADGSFSTIGGAATNKLSEGVGLTQSFREGGDYYLLVKGVDPASAEFAATNATENNFIGYEVTGSTVLVPQEDRVPANAPAGSDKVTIRLATDVIYCFSGVTTNDNPFLVEVAEASPFRFLKSTKAGDVELKISTGLGGEITYQAWNPGQVGFAVTARSVPESVNDLRDDWVEFRVSRTGGKSGRVKARVTVDQGQTTLDPARYVFQTNALNAADFTWEDGVTSNMTARVKIIDDIFYDGDFKVVFNLEVMASDAGDVGVADKKGVFTLTVVEDDKQEPGTAFFCGTDPGFARKGVVYARASEGARIFAKRVESFDGLIAGVINSSVGGVEFKTEDERDLEKLADIAPELVELFPKYREAQVLWWSSREGGEKSVRVSGISAGKTAKVTFTPVNMKTISASNTVMVVSVADDAPGFVRDASSFDLFRSVPCGDSAKVEIDPDFLQGGEVTFTKLSGTLPAGLKAEYDTVNTNLVFSGVPTAKPGTYTVVYQVVETRDGTRVPGLTTMVTFTVVDPADVKTNPEGANPAVAVTRTLKDLLVVDSVEKMLLGMLQLTIPSNGKLSGKLVCADGSIALTAKSWSNFIPKSRTLVAELAGKNGFAATVTVADDWSVRADLTKDEDFYGFAESDGIVWSKTNPASDWQGYYTVILPNAGVVREGTTGIAALGTAYVTLKMNTASSANAGKMTWAGLLPNGTAISGSTVLTRGEDVAWMPLYKSSSKELISGAFEIAADAVASSNRTCVIEKDDAQFFWKHVEKTPTACFEVNLDAFGSYYDSKNDDLASCCEEAYQGSRTLGFFAGDDRLANVTVSEKSIQLTPEQENPTGLKLSFARSTGVVSGSFKLDGVSCSYKGVILIGWGGIGCNCGDEPIPFKPFVGGTYYYSYKHEYSDPSPKRQRSLNMKCGDQIRIEADKK